LNYLEFTFTLASNEEYQRDLLINALAEIGFDTFEETSSGFKAYLPSSHFNEALLETALVPYQSDFSFQWSMQEIPHRNWNEEWESNFEPIVIKQECYVRATFHQPKPEFPLEIVIDPKMAFGTGHHQTTTLMLEFLLEQAGLSGTSVLDMGAGTGILAILAAKLGAVKITAIDYDPVCYDSIIENSRLNNVDFEEVLCGSKEIIPDKTFDVILANINRNILLDQLERYSEVTAMGGTLYLSGFYESDLPMLENKANSLGYTYVAKKVLENWCAVKFLKQN
jgi:ribosomal protein L11 methyltransferase